jgi:hypothetical protein
MPKTYYAVTTPIKSGSVEKVLVPHLQNTYRDKRELVTYQYNDLIKIINEDPNIKLFVTSAAANAYGAEKEVVEDKKEEDTPLLDLGLAVFMPHIFAMKVVTDVLLPPSQVRNLYQSIILKITIKNENSIFPDESNTPECEGVLAQRTFRQLRRMQSQETSPSFSTSSKFYLHTLKFRNDHNYSLYLTTGYPNKYRDIIDDGNVNAAACILKDYYAPKLGLFLTGHWNRKHKTKAKALYDQIQNLSRSDTLKILWDKRNELSSAGFSCNLEGSFFRRISYAIEVLTPKEPVLEQRYNIRI